MGTRKMFPWKAREEGSLSSHPLEVSVWFPDHERLFLGNGSEAVALRVMEVCYCLGACQVPSFLQGCSFLADVPRECYSCCVSLFFPPWISKTVVDTIEDLMSTTVSVLQGYHRGYTVGGRAVTINIRVPACTPASRCVAQEVATFYCGWVSHNGRYLIREAWEVRGPVKGSLSDR